MIDNPDKFQAIITNKRRENQITHNLKIYSNEIETTKSVKLLGIEIDNQLSLNQRISNLCIYLFIYLSIDLLIYWFINLLIYWFNYLFIYLFRCFRFFFNWFYNSEWKPNPEMVEVFTSLKNLNFHCQQLKDC